MITSHHAGCGSWRRWHCTQTGTRLRSPPCVGLWPPWAQVWGHRRQPWGIRTISTRRVALPSNGRAPCTGTPTARIYHMSSQSPPRVRRSRLRRLRYRSLPPPSLNDGHIAAERRVGCVDGLTPTARRVIAYPFLDVDPCVFWDDRVERIEKPMAIHRAMPDFMCRHGFEVEATEPIRQVCTHRRRVGRRRPGGAGPVDWPRVVAIGKDRPHVTSPT